MYSRQRKRLQNREVIKRGRAGRSLSLQDYMRGNSQYNKYETQTIDSGGKSHRNWDCGLISFTGEKSGPDALPSFLGREKRKRNHRGPKKKNKPQSRIQEEARPSGVAGESDRNSLPGLLGHPEEMEKNMSLA